MISKKASNKSCLELNFVKKSLRVYIPISPRSGARGLQKSICFKSYNVQIWKIRFILWLNDATKIDICACGVLCMKFNSEQLLFDTFFYVMRIFGSVEPQSKSHFPFLYIKKLRITLANIVFANMFGKFIFPRTSGEPGKNIN